VSLRLKIASASSPARRAASASRSQTAANAFAGTGVRVNAVLRCLVETQLTQRLFDEPARGGSKASSAM
jgi:NAD(P)-dependent dehydrogenase (short-subunit alcohol dehydrogenase family)